jgi:hypothetical protein
MKTEAGVRAVTLIDDDDHALGECGADFSPRSAG